MKRPLCHSISDIQLSNLLDVPEVGFSSSPLAKHLEECPRCQERLTCLIEAQALASEANTLLKGFSISQTDSVGRQFLLPDQRTEDAPLFDHDLLAPASHPEMLGRIGRYEVERCIGAGGMGIVFKAFDTELNRPVAIKVLASHLARNGAARQRFSRESKAAASVAHENVVAIHNVDSENKYPYLVMQFVQGESLQARVDREGPLSPERLLQIGLQSALGLAAAHQQGIIHRDIKPANILLEDGIDRLLITDFGLARMVDDASLTYTGTVVGTPNYMSPEQAKGDDVDFRTDLFSLGAVLYFAATGHPPFRAQNAMGVLNRICQTPHRPVWQVNSTIPGPLCRIIDRLLEKSPSKRYPSATSVAESITRLMRERTMRKLSLNDRFRHQFRRRPIVVTLVSLIILVGGILAWIGLADRMAPNTQYGAGPIVPSVDHPSDPGQRMQSSGDGSEHIDAPKNLEPERPIGSKMSDSSVLSSQNLVPPPVVLESFNDMIDFDKELMVIDDYLREQENDMPPRFVPGDVFFREMSAVESYLNHLQTLKKE